jgi:hypothetical protein
MAASSQMAYAQARIQARYAKLPEASVWQGLESAAHYRAYLEAARELPLRSLVATLNRSSDVHEVERVLRQQFRETVLEVAGWMPIHWRPAVHWVLRLPELPTLRFLLGGEPIPPWMYQDPAVRRYLHEDAAERQRAMAEHHAAPVLAAWNAGEPLELAWLRHWRSLWPARPAAWRDGMERLAALVQRHLGAFRASASPVAWAARAELYERFGHSFRRMAFQPAAAMCYLALFALSLERLRGGLVRRAAFRPVEEEA